MVRKQGMVVVTLRAICFFKFYGDLLRIIVVVLVPGVDDMKEGGSQGRVSLHGD